MRTRFVLLLLLTLGVGTIPSLASAQSTTMVINEIDYDQPGTDTAEFIELKNISTLPIDLTGWTLEFVNGALGGATIYNVVTLTSTVVPPGGYYVISLPSNSLQNGAPDAVALRSPAGPLVDTVSYEGNTGAPYTEGSGVGLVDDPTFSLAGISRFPDGVDTDVNNVDFRPACVTPGPPLEPRTGS